MATYDLDGVRAVACVCMGSECRKRGADDVLAALKAELKALDLRRDVHVVRTRCMGRCDDACNLALLPGGPWYGGVTPKGVRRIVREHLRDGEPVRELVTFEVADGHLRRTGTGKRGKPRR